MKYNPLKIEQKWRNRWPQERESYTLRGGADPYYCLDMISYPSSEGLHMGHWRPYTIADVWARYQTLMGKQVLNPVGFDAFGLPAENAAIKTKTPPQVYTQRSMTNFSRQIKEMGKMYDWSTLINTSSPEYYKWTQWLFIQLYKNGLAYRKSAPVNWCPSCQTVLANEQVVAGECERCGSQVIKKQLRQWFFKITEFAEQLLDFSTVIYPEQVKTLQTNWIGKSQGAEIVFSVSETDVQLKVFTTRPDTLMGVTYLVVAPEYEHIDKLITPDQKQQVTDYIQTALKQTEIERLAEDKTKTGVFTGMYAVHPLTNQQVPIWVADYVLGSYGTGAVMGVPAHDTRDFIFATDYNLPIIFVIEPEKELLDKSQAYISSGRMINSKEFNGLSNKEAGEKIIDTLKAEGVGDKTTLYRIRDWLVSRQRYWGAPIPIIYCETCGEQSVPEDQLPVVLPDDAEFMPTGGSPLERHETFKYTKCPTCGGDAQRETDTLDTFVDSSWYYLRFTDPKNTEKAFGPEQIKQWMPVDFYVGGLEHATLHLLYARFIMKALKKIDLVMYDEPFKHFYGNGMVYLYGKKMSKSKGNVVNPDDIVKEYGTDAMRGYILFMGPADQDVEWQANGISGVKRFLERAWKCFDATCTENDATISPAVQKAYQSINELLPNFHFNRCISSLMIAINELEKQPLNKVSAHVLCQLFAPFFPHFAEEVWEQLGNASSIFESKWPAITVEKETTVTYAVQINGKLRSTLTVDSDTSEDKVVKLAKDLESVATMLDGKNPDKTIFVSGRIVNFVVK